MSDRTEQLREFLFELLRIPSPTGRTDEVIQVVGERYEKLGLDVEVTRRGALVARLGSGDGPARAIVSHADTIGCMVASILPNGRLEVVPVGTHSARFAEGARVTIFTEESGPRTGTVLPRLASGHAYDDAVDTQGVGWQHVEVRLDEVVADPDDVADVGVQVGDFVAFDALPECTASGFVKSRHLDGKGGVAAQWDAARQLVESGDDLPVPIRFLVTVSEEVGHGASHGLDDQVAEMVSVDVGVVAPNQSSREDAVTVAMQDLHGPFDYHLTRHLLALARDEGIPAVRDVFRYYRSDVAAALEAGAATRASLIGYGVDATHGHERTHLEGLAATRDLLLAYARSPLTFEAWDREPTGPLEEFPSRSVQPASETPEIERT